MADMDRGASRMQATEPENTDKCLDGPSILCDLTNNCANGADEQETYCGVYLFDHNGNINKFNLLCYKI